MSRYRYLLFDADNTLFDFDIASRQAYSMVCRTHGLPDTDDAYRRYRAHNDAMWAALERKEITQEQVLYLRFEGFLKELGLEGIDPVACSHTMVAGLAQSVVPMDGALALLQALHEKYALYLITNALSVVQRNRLTRSGFAPYIRSAFISEEVGYHKPDPKYFDYVFAHIDGITKDNCLVIGDSPTSDLRGANGYGIPCVWFNRKGATLPEGIVADFEISSLDQLPALLER